MREAVDKSAPFLPERALAARLLSVFATAILLSSCAQLGGFSTDLPSGTKAYDIVPAPQASDVRDYRVGPLDTLSVTVFQEPDLTFKEMQIDAGGNLLFPLIGNVEASGKTAHQLSEEIASRLNQHYLKSAQVSVVVEQSASQHITVEGSVTAPGVYDINGTSSLLEAIARAKSPTRTAKLDQIVVFRTVDGKRMGAVFDLRKIRNGQAPDPELLGGDVVVVGFSAVKGAFRDFLSAAPLVTAFRYY
jgi:polysaccharide biosynthesis/export protein